MPSSAGPLAEPANSLARRRTDIIGFGGRFEFIGSSNSRKSVGVHPVRAPEPNLLNEPASRESRRKVSGGSQVFGSESEKPDLKH
jgi:hypothetical protein